MGAQTITRFRHADADAAAVSGRVTALTFCTDPLRPPVLLSASEAGSLAVWDLDANSLHTLVPMAHDGPVSGAVFLPGKAVFVTAGAQDNTLKQWALDTLDGNPKLVRTRQGHKAPPSIIRHYRTSALAATAASGADASVCEVLSAGQDRAVRMFHTALERQNCELSQGHLEQAARAMSVSMESLRLPPVVAMASSDRRHGAWCNVVTAHAGDHRAYTWNYDRKRIGRHVLPLQSTDEHVTAVAVSACGHFAIIGGSDGTLAQFNLQSGVPRGTFPPTPGMKNTDWSGARGGGVGKVGATLRPALTANPLPAPKRDVGKGRAPPPSGRLPAHVDQSFKTLLGVPLPTKSTAKGGVSGPDARRAHAGAVRGIVVDSLNKHVLSVGGDGWARVWDFTSHSIVRGVDLGSPACLLVVNHDSGLAAVACDDVSVRVLDMSSHRVVRRFGGHTQRLTDVGFSPDGRWLFTASMDKTVRVHDLITARCVDWMTFETPVTSLSMSPTSEYLVTAHVDSVGLFMWANRAHYSHVLLDRIPKHPVRMNMPLASTDALGSTSAADAEVGAGAGAGASASASASKRSKKRGSDRRAPAEALTYEAAKRDDASDVADAAASRTSKRARPTTRELPVRVMWNHSSGLAAVANDGPTAVDLGGWSLRQDQDVSSTFTFPAGTEVPAHDRLVMLAKRASSKSKRKPLTLPVRTWRGAAGAAVLADAEGVEVCRAASRPYAVDVALDLVEDTVRVTNLEGSALSLSGWKLQSDVGSQSFAYPDDLKLPGGASVTVWSGKGAQRRHDPPTDLFWTKRYVWNNHGDTAVVLDGDGNEAARITHQADEEGAVETVERAGGGGGDDHDVEVDGSGEDKEEEVDDVGDAAARGPAPKVGCGVTLAGVPKSQWQQLPVLDLIAKRNKPTEPAKAPELAPFFLPTATGLNPVFVPPTAPAGDAAADAAAPPSAEDTWASAWDDGDDNDEDGDADADADGDDDEAEAAAGSGRGRSRIIKHGSFGVPRTVLAQLLAKAASAADPAAAFEEVAAHLSTLAPSKVDVELRSLTGGLADADAATALVGATLDFFKWQLESQRSFELAEAQLNLFLSVTGDAIMADGALRAKAKALLAAHKAGWGRLEPLLAHNLCLVKFFSSLQT